MTEISPPLQHAICVRGLTKRFGQQVIFENLDLDVMRGEILGIAGGSGTGKSVLLRSILGLLPFEAGTVEVLGKNFEILSSKERIAIERQWGVLFQDGALFSSLNLLQNVQVPMRERLDLPQKVMDELALLKIAMVGLPPSAAFKSRQRFLAVCASAPGWRVRSRWIPPSCSWMSRHRGSTRSRPPLSTALSAICTKHWGLPST